MRLLVLIMVSGVVLSLTGVSIAADPVQLGRKIEGFQLQDFRGASQALADFKDRELVVVAFLGTECPLAKLYGPRLAELAGQYGPKNVGFIAIDANQQDTLAEMGHYARVSKIEFPFLKDPSNSVADLFGAVRTPEVFVLDKNRVVRYWGRIDDQFGIGVQRAAPQRKDLAVALDELLGGKAVTMAVTTATGCHIGRAHRGAPTGTITYARDIAPLIQKHCVVCHRAGEIGPFALTAYEDVVNWSATIREVVQEKRMPPWHAKSDAGKFVNDRRLAETDQKLLFDWIDNGMPQGNAADTPQPRQFTEGWEIPKPDLILEMAQPYSVPAKGTVEYQYFPLDQKIEEDKWVVAAEARPGNRAVVHHLILFYVPVGFKGRVAEASLLNSVATFAPGMPAWQARPGMAKRIPAGSKLYFQVHYTPNGVPATDLSRAALVFTDAKSVAKQLQTDAAVNFRLRIPPQADNASFEAKHLFDRDMQLVSLLPHMHLRGKAFRIEAIDPAGVRQLLVDVPHYDFNWQNSYVFAEPVKMREGSTLFCTAWYDNSDKNPANPDPKQTVGWGDQTWEEMLVAQFEAVLDDQDLRRGLPQVQPLANNEFEVEFTYRPALKAESVYLAGGFNEWKPTGHQMTGPDKDGVYKTKIQLKAGVHEYKFVIDGKTWRTDPANPDVAGEHANSVLRISTSKSP
ncbi:MAG: Peroxiredoxin [Planctomycetaceae bacterium]|nr:Peroxiredoxin [Planctomycetaceae bacterium]